VKSVIFRPIYLYFRKSQKNNRTETDTQEHKKRTKHKNTKADRNSGYIDLGAKLHHDNFHKRKSPEGFVSLSTVAVLEPKRWRGWQGGVRRAICTYTDIKVFVKTGHNCYRQRNLGMH